MAAEPSNMGRSTRPSCICIPASLDIGNSNENVNNLSIVQLIFIGKFLCVRHLLVSKVAGVTPTSQGGGYVGQSLVCSVGWVPKI